MITALLGLLGVGGVAGLALRLFGLSGTIAKVTSFGSGAKAVAQKVPRWVWIALAIVIAVVVLFFWHQHAMHKHDEALIYQAKHEQFAHDQAIADKARAQARAYKAQLDAANAKIHNQEQARHDQTVAANHALADALRLRIDQRARVQAGDRGSAGVSSIAAAGVQPGGSYPQADAQLGQGAARPVVCVDANQLVDYAEQADNDHDALVKTEDAQKRYLEHWPSTATAPPQ